MNIRLKLEKTVYTLDQMPKLALPQIALAGRSNVGKSSLLNALAGRKNLAKVSSSPGKTRSINFYLVEPYNFYLTDLPGYGYARASHDERNNWAKILERYLVGSDNLKFLALLLDCRLPPQRLDLNLMEYAFARNIDILPILTKVDKCSQRERRARLKEWHEMLGKEPVLVSAHKRLGLEKLWRQLVSVATAAPLCMAVCIKIISFFIC